MPPLLYPILFLIFAHKNKHIACYDKIQYPRIVAYRLFGKR